MSFLAIEFPIGTFVNSTPLRVAEGGVNPHRLFSLRFRVGSESSHFCSAAFPCNTQSTIKNTGAAPRCIAGTPAYPCQPAEKFGEMSAPGHLTKAG